MIRRIQRIAIWAAILAGAILPFVHVARATPDFPPLDPADLKLKDNPAQPGATAMYLYREIFINDKTFGRVFEEDNYRVKIFTEEGKKYGNVEVEYLQGISDVGDVHGRTIHPDGTVIEFKGDVVDKVLIKAGDIKIHIKSFLLPDVTPGSVIEYGFKFYFSGIQGDATWHVQDKLFTRKAHFAFLPYGSEMRSSLVWRAFHLPDAQPHKQGDGIWALDMENIPGLPDEENMMPVGELSSWIEFFYTATNHTSNPQEFWNQIAKSWADFDEKFIGNHESIRGLAAETIRGADTLEDKLRKLYVRAQQIHNLTFSPVKTTQEEKREKTIENNNVDQVLKNGAASKENVNRFFVALARAAGFEAGPAWVKARTNSLFHFEAQDQSELNESIVYVKAGDKAYYLDPGNIYCPFGMLPWYETSVTVFRPTTKGAVFEVTPDLLSSSSLLERRAQLKLDQDGSLSGTLTVRWAGQRAFLLRAETANQDEVARKKLASNEINAWLPSGAKFELTALANWDKTDQPCEAQGKLTLPDMGQVAGKRLLLPVGLYLSSMKQLFDPTSRKEDIYFPYPYESTDDFTIQIPPEWQLLSVPKPIKLNPGGGLRYELSSNLEAGNLHVLRRLVVGGMLYPADSYPEIRNFFHFTKSSDDQQLVLQAPSASSRNQDAPKVIGGGVGRDGALQSCRGVLTRCGELGNVRGTIRDSL